MADIERNAWYERSIITAVKHVSKIYDEFVTDCNVFVDSKNEYPFPTVVKIKVDEEKYTAFLLYSSLDEFHYHVISKAEGLIIKSIEVEF